MGEAHKVIYKEAGVEEDLIVRLKIIEVHMATGI